MAKFEVNGQISIFPKRRMAMVIHQTAKIQIGKWPVRTISWLEILANPNAY